MESEVRFSERNTQKYLHSKNESVQLSPQPVDNHNRQQDIREISSSKMPPNVKVLANQLDRKEQELYELNNLVRRLEREKYEQNSDRGRLGNTVGKLRRENKLLKERLNRDQGPCETCSTTIDENSQLKQTIERVTDEMNTWKMRAVVKKEPGGSEVGREQVQFIEQLQNQLVEEKKKVAVMSNLLEQSDQFTVNCQQSNKRRRIGDVNGPADEVAQVKVMLQEKTISCLEAIIAEQNLANSSLQKLIRCLENEVIALKAHNFQDGVNQFLSNHVSLSRKG